MKARSYYFGTGTRRHAVLRREGVSGQYVVLRCGLSGYWGKVMPSSVEPNCGHCKARLDAAEARSNANDPAEPTKGDA